MPFALVIVGLVLIVSGVKDTHAQFGAQLKSDLTGDKNFTQYALALFVVGALGYIDKLRPFSNAFMALIIIALLLSQKGFFPKFWAAWQQGPEKISPPASTGPRGPDASTISPLPGIPDLLVPGASLAIPVP